MKVTSRTSRDPGAGTGQRLSRLGLRRLRRNERGGIMMVAALTLPVILLTTAFCVDLGRLYLAKTKAEIAASLAVEAALERYPDIDASREIARRIALATVSDAGFARDLKISLNADPSEGIIQVSVGMNVKTSFAGALGFDSFSTGSISVRELP